MMLLCGYVTLSGTTNTAGGLREMLGLFDVNKGDRPGIRDVVVVVTGESTVCLTKCFYFCNYIRRNR